MLETRRVASFRICKVGIGSRDYGLECLGVKRIESGNWAVD